MRMDFINSHVVMNKQKWNLHDDLLNPKQNA